MAFGYHGKNKNKIKSTNKNLQKLSDNTFMPINEINNINGHKQRNIETICQELEKICQHIEVLKTQPPMIRSHSKGYATYTNFLPRISSRKSLCCPDEYISKLNNKQKSFQARKRLSENAISNIKLPVINEHRHRVINNPIGQSNVDVIQYTGRTRDMNDKRHSLYGKDRIPLKGDTVINGIKSRSPSLKSIHYTNNSNIADRKTSNISNLNQINSSGSVITDTMATLTLDNRHDMGSNDHAKHHNKRRQQWIRSEQVKNWTKNPHTKLTKKNSSGTSTSSGQKSDVVSGKSDDSIHTASSSSEYREQVLPEPMDLEMRQTFHKCMQWMETLPSKFSGMHIFVQPSETGEDS